MDKSFNVPIRGENSSLYVLEYGQNPCESGYSYGPIIRDVYLIHYAVSGEGKYVQNDKEYKISAGQGFLICPGQKVFYKADIKNPWHYFWVGFNGSDAKNLLLKAGLSIKNPIINFGNISEMKNLLSAFQSVNPLKEESGPILTGYMYVLLGKLIEETKKDSTAKYHAGFYINYCSYYIENNIARPIDVEKIANTLNISRSYLYRLFKEHYKTSIKGYIMDLKLKKAVEFIENKKISIGDISRSVGFEDPLYFSRAFKKKFGVSPLEYRKNNA